MTSNGMTVVKVTYSQEAKVLPFMVYSCRCPHSNAEFVELNYGKWIHVDTTDTSGINSSIRTKVRLSSCDTGTPQ